MTTPVIQELTIDARGSAAGGKVFEDAMGRAEGAADRARSAPID